MKPTKTRRRVNDGRQRCLECGHPLKEHRNIDGCTVPKCACSEHVSSKAETGS